ncbi:hypothetical protein PMAYCL1PPCAC_31203, partial [Pristionchus mayeri]
QIYSDDVIFDLVREEPYYEALKELFDITEAFQEGDQVKSINPRTNVIDIKYMDQTRPDFIGPKEPEYHVPAGPLLNRLGLEHIYEKHRTLVWNLLHEKAAAREHARVVRQKIADHKRNCKNKSTCRICNKPNVQ